MAMLEGHAFVDIYNIIYICFFFFVVVVAFFGFSLDQLCFARAWLTVPHGCIMLHLRKENSSEAQLGLQAGLHGGPKNKCGISCE